MIQIVKEGRDAFTPDVSPAAVCPYKTPFSPEQLAWSIGWYKAEVDHLRIDIAELKAQKLSPIDEALFKAQCRGKDDYVQGMSPETLCPYIGQTYRSRYIKGWNSNIT